MFTLSKTSKQSGVVIVQVNKLSRATYFLHLDAKTYNPMAL